MTSFELVDPATYNFDPQTLVSRWSHKSVAVIAGLGSFGHHRRRVRRALWWSLTPRCPSRRRPPPSLVLTIFKHLGPTEVCGKCSIGPCAFRSAV
jgi:hypothetical protein